MQKISKTSCYYYYGKQWPSWDQLRANFSWEIPAQMNAACYVCDSHARDRDAVAIYHEDYSGARGKFTFWELKNIFNEKFRGDWMLTGDLVIGDEDDYFTFISRQDDIIISSGYRIGPVAIEDTIIKHPAVLEAGVIGVPDETRGEIVKAFVALRPGGEPDESLKIELQEFVKQRLAKHEYPREIEFVSEIPKTTTGKIRRKDLRKREGLM
jgi:acyl-coenzyme A synthetase/AMP-(fatty) acid ligase